MMSDLFCNNNLWLNVIATFIALVLTYILLRPRLCAHTAIALTTDNRLKFRIKNVGLLKINSIKVEAFKCNKDVDNDVIKMEPIPLVCNYYSHMIGFYSHDYSSIYPKSNQNYARSYFEDAFIRVEVTSTHALSNITTVKAFHYVDTDIYCGDFSKGVLVNDDKKRIKTMKEFIRKANVTLIVASVVNIGCILTLVLLGLLNWQYSLVLSAVLEAIIATTYALCIWVHSLKKNDEFYTGINNKLSELKS